MDWTKAKTKHFLHTDFTLIERGALVTLFCLTAHLEEIPSEKIMRIHTSEHALKTIRSKLEAGSKTLRDVLEKVLEDVQAVNKGKKVSSQTSKTYRDKQKSDVSRDINSDVTEKRREEERREDIYVAKDFDLQNRRTRQSVLNYINKMNMPVKAKEKLRIAVMALTKDKCEITEIHEFIETFEYEDDYSERPLII